jgi:hypothetical protein
MNKIACGFFKSANNILKRFSVAACSGQQSEIERVDGAIGDDVRYLFVDAFGEAFGTRFANTDRQDCSCAGDKHRITRSSSASRRRWINAAFPRLFIQIGRERLGTSLPATPPTRLFVLFR